jgi:hypothetical protein
MSDVYIRSYNDYEHKFSIKSGTVIIPSRLARPSVVKVSKEAFDELIGVDEFNVLLNSGVQKYAVVDAMPADQLDVMQRISQLNDEAARAKVEADKAKAETESAKIEVERLKAEMEAGSLGSESEVVKLAKEAEAQAKKELEDARAELADLKAKAKKVDKVKE